MMCSKYLSDCDSEDDKPRLCYFEDVEKARKLNPDQDIIDILKSCPIDNYDTDSSSEGDDDDNDNDDENEENDKKYYSDCDIEEKPTTKPCTCGECKAECIKQVQKLKLISAERKKHPEKDLIDIFDDLHNQLISPRSSSSSSSSCESGEESENEEVLKKYTVSKNHTSALSEEINDVEIRVSGETPDDILIRQYIFNSLKQEKAERFKIDHVYSWEISPDKDFAIATTRSRESLYAGNVLMHVVCDLRKFDVDHQLDSKAMNEQVFLEVKHSSHLHFSITRVFASGLELSLNQDSFFIFGNLQVLCRDSREFEELIDLPCSSVRYLKMFNLVAPYFIGFSGIRAEILSYCLNDLPYSVQFRALAEAHNEKMRM